MIERGLGGLLGCGLLLLVLTLIGISLQRADHIDAFVVLALAQGAVYLLALRLIPPRMQIDRVLGLIIGIAALMRLFVVCAPPYLSTDLYRYIWDGRVLGAGTNPYRYIPTDPHLAALRDPAIFPKINRSNYAPTIYPPGAEAIFFALTRFGQNPMAIKVAMVSFEAGAIFVLLRVLAAIGLPLTRIAVYAWHPLPVWEFAGSGHIDAVIVFFLGLLLWTGRDRSSHASLGDSGRHGLRNSLTAILIGLELAGGTLIKFYPVALLPAWWSRSGRTMLTVFIAALLLAYLPFLGVGWGIFGFLPGYLGEEGFSGQGNGFYLWAIARMILPLGSTSHLAYVVLATALGGGLALFVARARMDPPLAAALLAGAFMLLMSPHYPWYFGWLVAIACVAPSAALVWLTLASFLLYLVPVGSQLVWDRTRLLVETALYLPFIVMAVADMSRLHRKTG